MLNGLLIDATNQIVRPIEVPSVKTFDSIIELIGESARTTQPIFIGRDILWIDESGLFHEKGGCFRMKEGGPLYHGNAVLLGCDESDHHADAEHTLSQATENIVFVPWAKPDIVVEKIVAEEQVSIILVGTRDEVDAQLKELENKGH